MCRKRKAVSSTNVADAGCTSSRRASSASASAARSTGSGACEPEDEDRTLSERGQLLHEVEERLLGPVQVLERDDERPLARERLEEPARGPRDLAGGAASALEPESLYEERRHHVRFLRPG